MIEDLLRKLLPIFLLLLIGFLAKRKALWSDTVTEGIKRIVVYIALPAVLFSAFSTMRLQLSYLLIFVIIFLYCSLLYGIGFMLNHFLPHLFSHHYTKGYMTGFEFGMIGVGLFGAIWGIDKLPIIMIIAFGHELFIWFIYVPLLVSHKRDTSNIPAVLLRFIKTPTILAISFGVIVNLFGIYNAIGDTIIGTSIYTTIDFLKPLTSPLVLIVIGYTMTFKTIHFKEIVIYIIARFTIVLTLGVLVLSIIQRCGIQLDPLFTTAFYAFILLPAPYILSVYIQEQEEVTFFTQLLVYTTAVSFIGYILLVGITGF